MTGETGVEAYPDLAHLAGCAVTIQVTGRVKQYVEVDYGDELALEVDAPSGPEVVRISGKATLLQVQVTAPAQWPPQPGDIWRDRFGVEYFVYTDAARMGEQVLARTADGQFVDVESLADWMLASKAPVALVYRPESVI